MASTTRISSPGAALSSLAALLLGSSMVQEISVLTDAGDDVPLVALGDAQPHARVF